MVESLHAHKVKLAKRRRVYKLKKLNKISKKKIAPKNKITSKRKISRRESIGKRKYPNASIYELQHGINSQASKNYRLNHKHKV